MLIDTKIFNNQIILECKPFFRGIDSLDVTIDRIETYFLRKSFSVDERGNNNLVVSKGNRFTNMFAFKMSKLKRCISFSFDQNDQVKIISVIDTFGQMLRQSEIDFFILEVKETIRFIQTKEEYSFSQEQNKKATIGNYLILFCFLIVFGFLLYIIIFLS
jgi:hypothetical protein